MLRIIQQILSKKLKNLAPFGANELNGKKTGVLYSRKGKIDYTFDFYYIKHSLVYCVNYHYYNDLNHRKMLNKIVNTTKNKKMVSPKEYLLMAEYFKLIPDYSTYLDVVNEWMCYNEYFFYEDIIISDLPEKSPAGFEHIIDDVQKKNNVFLKSEKPAMSGRIYADLYVINGKVCLITGTGKTDACKAIAEKCVAYDFVEFINGKSGLSCKWCTDTVYLTVDYCIHMDSINFDSIREVEYYEYLQKAQGNITYCDTSLPSFYSVIKCSNCKKIIVPYTSTLEEKSNILKDYLYK